MKYIRTKDGIYKITSEDKYTICYENKNKTICSWKETSKMILKQAETIEELCDEFVMETSINDKLFRTFFREHKQSKSSKFDMFKESWEIFNGYPQEIKDKKIHNYYGAIWTDKGLIYVVKMNDKGELELL